MKTVIGSVRHLLATGNKIQMLWGGGVLLTIIALAVLHHLWKGDRKKIRIWRLLCLCPLIICICHFLIYVMGFFNALGMFITMYAMAVLALIPIPFANRRIGYRIAASVTGILIALCFPFYILNAPNFFNYSRQSYTDSFRSLVKTMDKTYILKEWKEIDFKELEAKYMPLVEEAEKANDPRKYTDAVILFCNELHDGHVWIYTSFDKENYTSPLEPKKYGMAMIPLENGEVIAVCTDKEVNKLGIEDGTVITKWNGKPVLKAAEEDVIDGGLPVKANADIISVIDLSSVGGETVDVTFKDKSGKEKTVTLSAGSEKDSVNEAFELLAHKETDDYEEFLNQNFSTRMLDDKCGYLQLTAEETTALNDYSFFTSFGFTDMFSYVRGDHKFARDLFREKLSDLKAQGMEYLVIDLRNNMGGFDEIGCALTDLLTDEDWYGQGLGIRKNGKYTCVSDHGIHGTGEFADLEVIALTNFNCASAGDGTSLYLSRLPNVTLAGITDPEGCNQETGGVCVLSGGQITVCFPTGLILDENCVPNVDTKADRISRNPLEVRIPLDKETAMKIFHDKEDYELQWAVDRLENKSENDK